MSNWLVCLNDCCLLLTWITEINFTLVLPIGCYSFKIFGSDCSAILQYKDSYIVLAVYYFNIIIPNIGFQKIVLDACSMKLSIKYDVITEKTRKWSHHVK